MDLRPGVCNTCGHASFVLAIVKSQLLRNCTKCNEVINLDKRILIRKGKVTWQTK